MAGRAASVEVYSCTSANGHDWSKEGLGHYRCDYCHIWAVMQDPDTLTWIFGDDKEECESLDTAISVLKL